MDTVLVDSGKPSEDSVTGVRWLGLAPQRVIVAALVLYAAGTVTFRAMHEEDPHAKFQEFVGVPYSDFFYHFGTPEQQEPDGRGGTVMRYEKVIVSGDRFALIPFHVYADGNMRIYRVTFE